MIIVRNVMVSNCRGRTTVDSARGVWRGWITTAPGLGTASALET